MDVDALFEDHYEALFRYLHRLTGDADAADDYAQEAFVRLLEQSDTTEKPRSWLFTVATNLVRDGSRTEKRRDRLLEATPVRPSAPARPDERLERGERIRAVRAALEQLKPRDRTILLMREEGFRYAEIAEAVGVAPGSVGTLAARALRKFQEAYPSDEDDDGPHH